LLETSEAAEIIRAAVDEDAEIIYGTSIDETLGDNVRITLIATGFEDHAPYQEMAPRRIPARQPQPSRERVFRVQDQQQPPPARQRQPGAPVLPDDDWEGESSIIRFLRER
jgi:cell division protein FtsZ